MVEQLCSALQELVLDRKAVSEVINFCSGEETKLRTIVEKAFSFAGQDVSFEEMEVIRSSHDRYVGDPTLLEKTLGFRPFVDWEDMFKKTISGTNN